MDSSKEIKLGKDVRDKLRAGVNKLASAVLVTMGPKGKTVIIADEFGEPYITKDGVSVSNYVTLEDPVENIAATLLKQVAQNTVEQAGDGTTTSICLAQSFINKGLDLIDEGISYEDIKKELEKLEEEVVFNLIKYSKELVQTDIVNVATISSNNDTKIGTIIQEAYNHSNIVKVEEGKDDDELITINGMQLHTTYFDKAFINNGSKQSIEYEKARVIIIGGSGKLDTIEPIAKLLQIVKSEPVIIIADHFSEQVVSLLKDNYNRGALKVALVKSPGFGQHRKDLKDDLAIYTGATIINPHKTYVDPHNFGTIDKIAIYKDKCILSNENEYKGVEDLLETLKTLNDSTDNKHDKDLLEQRISNLTGKVSIIKVGGKSEVEMKERKDRIDDAVLAVHSALEEGIVLGGGVALKNIYYQLMQNSVDVNYFIECIKSPSDLMGIKSVENYIIDPLKVTRCALQNAISVAKTILGTEAIVLNEQLWR